jgi:hypothetical protein
MSFTNVYAVWPGDRHNELAELRNGHLGAPIVWGEIFAKHCDVSESPYPKSAYMFRTEELWPLWKRTDIAKHQRAVLGMTYDNAYIEREHYSRAAADIRATISDLELPAHSHWPRIADIFESNPDCPAIGFRWTSVCEDPFKGEWDEEAEDYGPPDWKQKWSMYPLLDSFDQPARTDEPA